MRCPLRAEVTRLGRSSGALAVASAATAPTGCLCQWLLRTLRIHEVHQIAANLSGRTKGTVQKALADAAEAVTNLRCRHDGTSGCGGSDRSRFYSNVPRTGKRGEDRVPQEIRCADRNCLTGCDRLLYGPRRSARGGRRLRTTDLTSARSLAPRIHVSSSAARFVHRFVGLGALGARQRTSECTRK